MAQTVVPPTLSVQRIAPQLVAFAGSPSNFQNLVTGLAQGTPVQLISLLPDGFTQIVTFTPAAPLAAEQIAQVLETARQRLIGLGIATPTAEQLAVTLMGGVVPTALGGSQVAALLTPPTPPSPAVQVQSNAAAGASAATPTSTTPSTATTPVSPSTPPVNVQLIPGTASTIGTGPLPRVNTSDSLTPAGATSRSPTPAAPFTPAAPAPAQPPAAAAPQPGSPNAGLRTAK